MGFLSSIIAFVFVLGVMVLVHELGHFLAARYFDVKVDAFAFGFGPRLFGFRGKETDYKVCLLPLGGFVKMAGENPGESSDNPRDFMAKPRWQRIVIALGGPVFNFVLAGVLLVGLFMVHYEKLAYLEDPARVGFVAEDSGAARAGIQRGDLLLSIDGRLTPDWESVNFSVVAAANSTIQVAVDRNGRTIEVPVDVGVEESSGVGDAGWVADSGVLLGPVEKGRPAEEAGIQPGDRLVSVSGERVYAVRQVPELVRKLAGSEGSFEIERGTERLMLRIAPVFDRSEVSGGAWRIGVGLRPEYEMVQTALPFSDAVRESVRYNLNNATLIFTFLRRLVVGQMSARSIEGPIGIARISGEAARSGLPQLVMIMAIISLNLGIFNLLPIPILDGGMITMLLIESMLRCDLSLAVKERVLQFGFLFLILLFAYVMYNDIVKSIGPG